MPVLKWDVRLNPLVDNEDAPLESVEVSKANWSHAVLTNRPITRNVEDSMRTVRPYRTGSRTQK